MKNSGNKSINTGKKILFALLVLLVILIGICAAFVMQYYPADDTAMGCIAGNTDGVTVTETKKEIIFMPDNPQAGFIFYPGAKVSEEAYAPLLSRLAQNGICCVAVRMPLRIAVLDINAADGIQMQFPQISKWYIGGHSLGGSAAAMYLEKHPDEYEGLVLLGSYSTEDLSCTSLRVLTIYGENDGVINRTNYNKDRVNLPADTTEYVIPGGNHAYFGSYGEQKGDGTATVTAAEQQEVTAEIIEKWMLK